MDKFLNNISDALKKVFANDWIILAVTLGGILAVFALAVLIGALKGDFIRCRKACKFIIGGETEKGLNKLKKQAPGFNPKLEIAPPASAFDFDKIIAHPYSYSAVKRSAAAVLGATVFFAALAAGLCVLIGAGGAAIALCLIAAAVLGALLYPVCLLISAASLRKATAAFNKAVAAIKGLTVTAAPEFDYVMGAGEDGAEVSLAVTELYLSVRRFATEGGEYSILQSLYERLKEEKDNPANLDGVNERMLSEAADILEMLLDAGQEAR